jgi:secreted Zn-dependent insulinase-like peptidase
MFGSLKDFVNEISVERSVLAKSIEALTYDQFKQWQSTWMKTGRAVWLVTGNISEEQAKSFIQLQNPIEPLSVDDVIESRMVAPTGNSRVNKAVVDAKNDNSAFISYYQVNIGNENLKDELTFKVVSKFIA